MAVEQRRLVQVMQAQTTMVEERYPGYHSDLFDFVAQIVMLEREHEQAATQIQKKVSDRIDALSKLLIEYTEASR